MLLDLGPDQVRRSSLTRPDWGRACMCLSHRCQFRVISVEGIAPQTVEVTIGPAPTPTGTPESPAAVEPESSGARQSP